MTHFAVCNAICYNFLCAPLTAKQTKIDSGGQGYPPDPIATPQASKVPPEESLYNDVATQDQRVPEESLCDGRVGPAGNVPTGRGGNVQEALYSQPDTSKKNANVSVLNTDNLSIAN